MSSVRVCALGDLDEDIPFVAQVDGVDIAVVLTEGSVYAIRNECSHADVALSDGEVDDCHLECWMHGSRFNLKTGEPDSLPATQAVDVYAVEIQADDVLVDVASRPSIFPTIPTGSEG